MQTYTQCSLNNLDIIYQKSKVLHSNQAGVENFFKLCTRSITIVN